MILRGGYEDDEEDEGSGWKHVSVVFVKDDVAGIFARSTRGEKEFKDFTINQRTAVGVARYIQDPLIEFAGTYMCTCFAAEVHSRVDTMLLCVWIYLWPSRDRCPFWNVP